MKIPVERKNYQEVMSIKAWEHKTPVKQSAIARYLFRLLSASELRKVHFQYSQEGMEQLDAKQPALFLMNHSSFIDLKIAFFMLQKRPFHIVCTNDGFVGKEGLMRWAGCIPTRKFMTDVNLVRDMNYVVKEYQSSILMYPEASYSFDGSQTNLPESLGKCIKLLKIPVVMIKTKGAFLRDPLYNALQVRQVDVSAKEQYLLSPKQIEQYSVDEINEILKKQFTYDHFREQYENKICVHEPFRGDGLHRVLYKCNVCGSEEHMQGQGVYITCRKCGTTHELTEYGKLKCIQAPKASEGNTGKTFAFVTDWYAWQRTCVRQEIQKGTYQLEVDVDIMMLVDEKKLYAVGEGHLSHSHTGFTLTGCDGQLKFQLKPTACYSLYADYFWYEIGDMISIGDGKIQYYCFPKGNCNVAKARLATEELFSLFCFL